MSKGAPFEHIPVLAREVVTALLPSFVTSADAPAEPPAPGGVFVDCTVGGGGHAEALLAASPHVALVGMDRDPDALEAAGRRLAPFSGRVVLLHRRFGELAPALEEVGARNVRAVLYDLGVSSPHLDRPDRGFGFRSDGPLDMRMD